MAAEFLNGYELIGDWKNSSCGKTAKAKKGGKTYFLKKYQTPVQPVDNGAIDAKTFAQNKELFDDFYNTRKRINTTIRPLAGPGGNIIIPSSEFISGNQYVEAAEFVEGVVPDDELERVLATLSIETKKLLMQTAAGALFTIHSKGIVHSDLKLKNVLLAKTRSGNYVAKLIDFDSSYFVDKKPAEITGDINYYSPELGAYADAEDDKEELGEKLTQKSDIFSLGLIFHYYLSGSLPDPADLTEKLRKRLAKGKKIYSWVVLNSGCKLELSPKIDSPKYVSLIQDMLDIDPEKRPTASDILRRLREAESTGPSRSTARPAPAESASTPEGFCAPRPEDGIELDQERLKSRGFVSSVQTSLSGIQGYTFYRADGRSIFLKRDDLLAMKYAKPVSSASETPSLEPAPEETVETAETTETKEFVPWPEHSIEFDKDMILKKGFCKVEQDTMGGVKGYKFIRPDGKSQFIRLEIVLVQKMAHKI